MEGDPLFISPAAPVLDPYAITVVTGDYHINPGSPAIDSANSAAPNQPATDIEGNLRLDDPSVTNTGAGVPDYYDRGAYEFQPSDYAPFVTTQAVTGIGATSATGNGTIIALGSDNPTEHGFVWDIAINPTIALSTKTTDGPLNALGSFASSMTGLTPGTQYHVRAYATNSVGTSYGSDVTFTTGSGTVATYTSGSGNWVAPAGVTSVIVEVWGGGGKGASFVSASGSGGGGGGGGYSKSTVSVTPGNSYAYVVGAGSTTTSPGGNSSFGGATVVANGGNSVANNSATGVAGGASGTGTFIYSGGGGATGSGGGGGGGSSAGTAANGTTATSSAGATAPTGGGNGGGGKTFTSGNGTNGSTPGGAGGGAYRTSSGSATGGSGANGQVKITYVEVPLSTTTSVSCGTNTVVYGGNITCTATVTASSGTPTGTVSWVTSGAGSFTTSPCTLASGSCSVTYAPSTLGSGSHSITANYGGSASYLDQRRQPGSHSHSQSVDDEWLDSSSQQDLRCNNLRSCQRNPSPSSI